MPYHWWDSDPAAEIRETGRSVLRKFSFSYDTPGLTEAPGVELFTPVEDEVLAGIGVELPTPFVAGVDVDVVLQIGQMAAGRDPFGGGDTGQTIIWLMDGHAESSDGLVQSLFGNFFGGNHIIKHGDPISMLLVNFATFEPGVVPTAGEGVLYCLTFQPSPV